MTGPPKRIGRYEIEGELGRGMMGVVYRALDRELGRTVALKTVSLSLSVGDAAEREAFEKRFLVEARSAAGLSHPGIIVVHDFGRDDETRTLYIALEHLKGRTLSELTSGGRALPWAEALRITARVAEALHHAHSHGVVHRDVKPANIMVLESGQPRIMDFGIAKVDSAGLTSSGQFWGTPRYMSPEQALGKPVDARADLFALGAVLYNLLTGRAAFDAKEVPMILTQVIRDEPPPPSEVVGGIPPDVDYVVARALAKAPADRHPTGQALAEDLEDVLAGRPPRHRVSWSAPAVGSGTVVSTSAPTPVPSPAQAVPDAPRLAPRPSPARLGLWALAVVVVLGSGLFALVKLRSPSPAETPPAAPTEDVTGPVAPPDTLPSPDDAPPEATPVPEAPRSAPTSAKRARLLIDFEHSLKSGTLRLWVDDTLLVQEDLEGRVTRDLIGLKLRTGGFEREVELEPGRRTVRVEVVWEDNKRSDTLSGTLRPGKSRRLEIRLGRLRKNLSAEWK